MLIKTVIKINDLYYAGDSEETYQSKYTGTGWQNYKGNELNILLLTDQEDKAYIVEGQRNLKSKLDSIMMRVQDGCITFDSIQILKIN